MIKTARKVQAADSSLHPQPKRLRRHFIHQNAGQYTVNQTENNGHDALHQSRHTHTHQVIAPKVSQDGNKPVSASLHLRPRRIGLEQLINRQIMYGKEYTLTYGLQNDYYVMYFFSYIAIH